MKLIIVSIEPMCENDKINDLLRKWRHRGYNERDTLTFPDVPYLRFPTKGYELSLEISETDPGEVASGSVTIKRADYRVVCKGSFLGVENHGGVYGTGTFVEEGLSAEVIKIRWSRQ
jgi:hypothetical protein